VSIGQPLTRREDQRFLTGKGRYAENTAPKDALAALFVRSPHAFADVKSVGTQAALAIKGVVAVITMDDIKAADVKNLSQPRFPGAVAHSVPPLLGCVQGGVVASGE